MAEPAPVSPPVPTAAVLVIGSEVLSGRTQDTNVQYLARGLSAAGVRLREVRVVPDDADMIVDALDALRARYDHVFTTGGIGPTHDDITTAAVARAFGVAVRLDDEARARLDRQYHGAALNPARLKMAHLPAGAELIDNPVSLAPGFRLGNVFVLAGVPRIMQAMFDGLRARLAGGPPLGTRTVSAYLAEGDLAEGLTAVQIAHPDLDLGSYPFVRDGRLGVSLVVRGPDSGRLDAVAAELRALVRAGGAAPVGDDPPPLDSD